MAYEHSSSVIRSEDQQRDTVAAPRTEYEHSTSAIWWEDLRRVSPVADDEVQKGGVVDRPSRGLNGLGRDELFKSSIRTDGRLISTDPKFDGNRDDFPRFSAQLHTKPTANHDHSITPQSRITYLASRLGESAYAHLRSYYVEGKSRYDLLDFTDGLAILDQAYGDQNRVNNARRKLFTLRQNNREFGPFFAEFHRQSLEAEMDPATGHIVLENAISRELRDQLIHASNVPQKDYLDLAKFLQT